eukprot:TRINITY_DN1814_c4_g1_i1.p1 TRINITY_DN1814_c4_g1~~TRINITY_DN1814_c4_g1_i1.p1  ORF type:complete len:808 (+),score=255.49 TRINITY_DN1814_c4_g1_i1:134-2557(+)
MSGWVANDHTKHSAIVGGSVVDKLRQRVHCRFCGGKSCRHEDWTKAVNRKNTHVAIRGLHSNWVENWAVASQRLHTVLMEKYDIVKQFKDCNLGAVFNLQECGEHPFCGPQGKLFAESGFSYVPETDLMQHGIAYYNFPWPDMWTPNFDVVLRTVQIMCDHVDRNETFLVHCHAGLGRTGLMIACWIMYHFNTPFEEAVRKVREQRPGAVQTKRQYQFTQNFHGYLVDLRKVFVAEPLKDMLDRQNSYLHGQEARALRHVPKLAHTVLTRLLDLVDLEFSEHGTTATGSEVTRLFVAGVAQTRLIPSKHAKALQLLKKKVDAGAWAGVAAAATPLPVLVELLGDFFRTLSEPALCPTKWGSLEADAAAYVKAYEGGALEEFRIPPRRARGGGPSGVVTPDPAPSGPLLPEGTPVVLPPELQVNIPAPIRGASPDLDPSNQPSPSDPKPPGHYGPPLPRGGGGARAPTQVLQLSSLAIPGRASNPQSPAMSPVASSTCSMASGRSNRKLPPLGYVSDRGDASRAPSPVPEIGGSGDHTAQPTSPACAVPASPPSIPGRRRHYAFQCRTAVSRSTVRLAQDKLATTAFRGAVALSHYHTTGILLSALHLISWDLPREKQTELIRAGVKLLSRTDPSDELVDFFHIAAREWGDSYFSRDGACGDAPPPRVNVTRSVERTHEEWLSTYYSTHSSVPRCPYRYGQPPAGDDASEGYGTGDEEEPPNVLDDEDLMCNVCTDSPQRMRGGGGDAPQFSPPRRTSDGAMVPCPPAGDADATPLPRVRSGGSIGEAKPPESQHSTGDALSQPGEDA